MAAFAPSTSIMNSFATPGAGAEPLKNARMVRAASSSKTPSRPTTSSSSSRNFFSRSRKPPSSSTAAFLSTPSTTTFRPEEESLFSSQDSNFSTAALTTSSTSSRTSRFFRRFTRQKPPPVPSLPPSLVLDLDAGTALPRALGGDSTPTPGRSGAATPTPTAAAAIISAYTAAESIPKPQGLQRKRMLEALANARLDVGQTRDLVRMCGLQIRERGLDTPGLFRPFRVAESQDRALHMIQLFLLSIDPSTYGGVFPILPENALDRFTTGRTTPTPGSDKSRLAKEELDKELRYASPHDVVSVFKWGLRHMRLRTTDFDSNSAEGWYEDFTRAEREARYHPRAIADLLHPVLPQATAELLSEVLDLMASVVAHASSNHMPPSAMCKVVGFWMFGRIGVAHPPPTFDELAAAVDRSAAIAEHLLLAHIRSQAAVTFSMPLRLTELVEKYPYIKEGSTSPGLPAAFAARKVPTLRVDLRSENLVVSQAKPRTALSTLSDALDAGVGADIKGDQGEMWKSLAAQVEGSGGGLELVIDEHARILRQVDSELKVEEKSEGEKQNAALASAAAATLPMGPPNGTLDPKAVKANRRRSQSLSDLRGHAALMGRHHPPPSPAPLAPLPETPPSTSSPRRKPVPLLTQDDSEELEVVSDSTGMFAGGLMPSSSWRSFSEEGFGGMSTASSDLSLNEFEVKPPPTTLPSRRSQRSLYRAKSSASNGSRRHPFPLPPATTTEIRSTHTSTAATLTETDMAFAIVWQDQLLDSSPCCSFPSLVFVQLKEKQMWLLVVETVIPPRPPTPPAQVGRKGSWRGDADAGSQSDRRSIFAPSIKSVRMRLRRVSTIIGNGVQRKKQEPVPDLPERPQDVM